MRIINLGCPFYSDVAFILIVFEINVQEIFIILKKKRNMKQINYSTVAWGLILLLYSCGASVKVTDAWKADDIDESKSDKFVVMTRVDDMVTRQRFESEITNQLKALGVDAVESFKSNPNLNLNQKMSQAEIDVVEKAFLDKGINGIILTVVKDKTEKLVTSTSGGYVAGGYYPSAYMGYGAFDGYYGSYYSPYGMGGTYIPPSSRTYTSETYKLETVIYDLNREHDRQLMAVVSVDITDPTSASKVAPAYAKKVIQQFE